MTAMNRVLNKAAWRVRCNTFLLALTVLSSAAIIGIIVLRLTQQVVVFDVPWRLLSIWIPVGSIVLAMFWPLIRRPNRKAVALQVDQGANLKEILSTALYCENSQDPWAIATIATAERAAVGVQLRQAVPISGPRSWPLPFALSLSFAIIYIAVPKLDLFSNKARIAQEIAQKQEVTLVSQQAQEFKNKLEQMTQDLNLDTKLDELSQASKSGPIDPDAIRRSAIKNLTKLRDELSEKTNSESALKMEATKKALEKLTPQGDQTSDLTKAMSSGDFSQMKQELDNLKGKLESGKLSQAELDQTAEQLKKLAEQINKEALKKSDLAKKLEQAGLDKNLASNPEAAKKAIDQAQNLTEKEKQDLKKQADASQQSAESLSQMAETLQKMASECKNCNKPGGNKSGQSNKSGQQGSQSNSQKDEGQKGEGQQGQGQQDEQGMQSASQLSDQLSEMEQVQQEMEAAQAAMSECNSAMSQMGENQGQSSGMGEGMSYAQNQSEGNSDYSQGDSSLSQGRGRGGPGQAQGGRAGESPADFSTTRKVDNKNQTSNGPIVASRLVEGDAVLNDSVVAFESAVTAADGQAADEVTNNVIPRDRQEAVKNYFGKLKKKADEAAKKNKAAPKSEDTKPSEAAKDAN